MIVFFLAQKKTTLIPNAENKDRSGVLWLRNLNLSFFSREKKDSRYGNRSTYVHTYVCVYVRACAQMKQLEQKSAFILPLDSRLHRKIFIPGQNKESLNHVFSC